MDPSQKKINRRDCRPTTRPAILSKNMQPRPIRDSSMANGVSFSSRSRPTIIGQRQRPFIPMQQRHDTFTYNKGSAKRFSSTTIVNGALQRKTNIAHGINKAPEEVYYVGSTEYLIKNEPTNTGSHEVLDVPIETLEVPVETLVSDDNEIQAIHVGNFSNILCKEGGATATKAVLIASNNSSGVCYVTVQPNNTAVKEDNGASKRFKSHTARFGTRRGIIRYGRSRMIADALTCIPAGEFKEQLTDTSDITGQMEIAPPTKQFMYNLNTRGVNKLFANPGKPMSSSLSKHFIRHLTTQQVRTEAVQADMGLQPLGSTEEDASKVREMTRKRTYHKTQKTQSSTSHEQPALDFKNVDLQMAFLEDCANQTRVLVERAMDDVEEYNKQKEIKIDHTDQVLIPIEGTSVDNVEGFSKQRETLIDWPGEDMMNTGSSLNTVDNAQQQQFTLNSDKGINPDCTTDENKSIPEAILPMLENKSTIIMVHEEPYQSTTTKTVYDPKCIEVILAAAEKRGISRSNVHKVIICRSPAVGDVPTQEEFILPPGSACEDFQNKLQT